MKKTGSTIEKDIFNLITTGVLKSTITGNVYREGMRPFNAVTEDAVVSFMTGLDGQFQVGVLNINVYVPEIDNGSRFKVKNIARCNVIEEVCSTLVSSLKSKGYRFSLNSIIQTYKSQDIEQHFVNVKLKFEYVTF